ncbi:MAG TPA: hypothetical protein VFG20_10700 [Planctomycetaceae bacterium]|nr:hypothetical protein [Planctomycetaceae bacterium]
MKRRIPLRNNLIKAWLKCKKDYDARRINSERTLQAALWAHLTAILRKDPIRKHQRLFLEPIFRVEAGTVYPDLVICNCRTIIGVVEIKYLPRARPKFSKDLKTLAALASQRKNLKMENLRYRGVDTEQAEFQFSEHVLFCWAGIHRREFAALDEFEQRRPDVVGEYYFEMHGLTEEAQPLSTVIVPSPL